MAGAGYKLFATGDVLTASDVNTYLMQQTVMVFADAAARTTALSGVVAEGMLSYLKDTNAVEVYNGSSWVASDDPNAIQNTIVDAKGDLITATGADTPARLAVGSNGDTLVADSAATTGLRWTENYAAGKNKIINGDFGVWQRGTSFSNPAANAYTADRWFFNASGSGATRTISQQTFTPGAAPVAGYEGQYFFRYARTVAGTGATADHISQRIEDVRTFADETATMSFWAKVDAGTPTLTLRARQNFGSGGSALVDATDVSVTLSTSWTRYTATFAIPSISGKTIGTSSNLELQFRTALNTVQTLDLWGVQVEASSVATAFQTATGTLQGELAACQRYYASSTNTGTFGISNMQVIPAVSTTLIAGFRLPQRMRTAPTVTLYSRSGTSGVVSDVTSGANTAAATANNIGTDQIWGIDSSSLTTGRGYEVGYTASSEL
jgi:hypothetical protein